MEFSAVNTIWVLVGAALVFGVVAGSTMVGINWAAGSYNQRNQVEISQAETLPSSDGSAAASSDSTSGQVSGMADKKWNMALT